MILKLKVGLLLERQLPLAYGCHPLSVPHGLPLILWQDVDELARPLTLDPLVLDAMRLQAPPPRGRISHVAAPPELMTKSSSHA